LTLVLHSNDVRPSVMARRPEPADVPLVAALSSEMQQHYGAPVTDEAAELAAHLACRPVTGEFDPRTIIALCGDTVCGSIVLNVTFPASELTRSLYVRDLYVARAMRRRGVGQVLLAAAARLTLAEGFSALDWTTEGANQAAQALYDATGASRLNRTFYRLAGEGLLRLQG